MFSELNILVLENIGAPASPMEQDPIPSDFESFKGGKRDAHQSYVMYI